MLHKQDGPFAQRDQMWEFKSIQRCKCAIYEPVHRKLEGKRSGVKKKCYQKKLRKIMEIALEKFRLPAPGSARSGLLSPRNRGLKIGTFLKKISFQLCFCSEVQKCIKNMFV